MCETAVVVVAARSTWNISSDAVQNAVDQFLGGEDLPKRLANQHSSQLLLNPWRRCLSSSRRSINPVSDKLRHPEASNALFKIQISMEIASHTLRNLGFCPSGLICNIPVSIWLLRTMVIKIASMGGNTYLLAGGTPIILGLTLCLECRQARRRFG